MTIVLFKVLGAFSNIPFDPSLEEDQRHVTVEAVSHTHAHTHTHMLCIINCPPEDCVIIC